MNRPSAFHPDFAQAVTSPSWSHCEDLIKAFEDAWRSGSAPLITDYLWSEGEIRTALLMELIHVDMEFRLKSGKAVELDNYLEAFPEIEAKERLVADLRAAEEELRDRLSSATPATGSRIVNRTWIEPASRDSTTAESWPEVPGYEIVARIGRGGMGIVYQARDPSLGRHVALKFLPDEYMRDTDRLGRFLREARTASALNHPHICTIHALGELNQRPFIVMEYVEGETLKAHAASRPSASDVARWIGQAARALAAAHAAAVIHRDIKPENIMVREDALLGTFAYMSPEQTRGAVAESASDIFALGIVAYELLTGRHPFDADSPVEMLSAIATAPVVPVARINLDVPVAMSNLVEAMLSKDPLLRPTAERVAEALETMGEQPAARAADSSPSRPIVRRLSELEALRTALSAADEGRGSMVSLSGEPGIGKTTLVDDFLSELASRGSTCLVARGHCSERLAATEAYLPVIDALQDLLRSAGRAWAARLMKAVAPTWHALLVPSSSQPDATEERTRAASGPAMLREFAKFIEEASRLATVVLFFDDVHWADLSTVDLLAHLGQSCHCLRLLVITTHRPTEMLLARHPFRNVQAELQARGMLRELPLGFLGRDEIGRYL
jgi:hypothetical protein